MNAERLSGRPTVNGRRVPARFVAETLRTANGVDLLREEFDLEPADICNAVRWLESVDSYLAASWARSVLEVIVDESLRPRIGTELRNRGRTAVSLAQLDLRGTKDEPLVRTLAERPTHGRYVPSMH